MATQILMKNPSTGIVKKGFYGFSWTTFCFSGIPAMMRGDILTGILITCFCWCPLVTLIMAFKYNKMYTTKLVEQGYEFADNETANEIARVRLGIVSNKQNKDQ